MPTSQFNLLDILVACFLAFFVWRAWKAGFWTVLADFLSFLLSLAIALLLYSPLSGLLVSFLPIKQSMGSALGFLILGVIAEALLGYLFIYIAGHIPAQIRQFRFSKLAASILSAAEVFVLVSFFLTLLLALPISPSVKTYISNSKIGSYLTGVTSKFERNLAEIFGEISGGSLTHLVVEQGGRESVILDVDSYDLSPDYDSEFAMLDLANSERRKAGVRELEWDTAALPVARAYAEDMWKRKYFSHYSPEGTNVGDRLESSGISYGVAGENLALAPTLEIAHEGLMNSPGHRANILSPDFAKVGIGVVDNGYYGKIFVQIFTD